MNPCMQSKVLFPRFFKTQKVCFVGHLPESESNTSSLDSLKNGVSLPKSKQSGRGNNSQDSEGGLLCHQGQGPCHVAVLTLLMSLLPYDQLSIPFILNFLFLKTREKAPVFTKCILITQANNKCLVFYTFPYSPLSVSKEVQVNKCFKDLNGFPL